MQLETLYNKDPRFKDLVVALLRSVRVREEEGRKKGGRREEEGMTKQRKKGGRRNDEARVCQDALCVSTEIVFYYPLPLPLPHPPIPITHLIFIPTYL